MAWLIDVIAGVGLALVLWHASLGRGAGWRSGLSAVTAGVSYVIAFGLLVIVLVGLPIPGNLRNALYASHSAGTVLDHTAGLQAQINHFISHDIEPTFLTITAKSDTTTIELGFRVTNGKIRPDLEQQMLGLINQERTSRGLSALALNVGAQAVARVHSQDMFARGYFSHYTPEGTSPFQRLSNAGVTFYSAGENLALAPTLKQAHNGLMNSPEHRANILESQFHSVGIGIVDGGRYGLMITQDFTN